jgi:hypothetical protein
MSVYSNQGSIENFTFIICTNCNGNTNPYTSLDYALANYFNAGDFAYGNTTDLTLPTKEWIFLPNFNGSLPATSPPAWPQGPSYTLTAKDQAVAGLSESFSNGLLIQGINMTGTNIYLNYQMQQIANIQNAHIITIDLSRIGYVTIENNTTVVTPADNTSVFQQVELKPYQNGFLYNTEITQDQLSTMNLEAPIFP